VVGVKVITREEGSQSIMITLQDAKEGQDNGDTCATIQRLLDDTGIARVGQVVTIISLVGARKNENLSIAYEERVKTCARLAKKALFTDDPTKLFGP
jgi:hypothetical protein